MYRTRSDQQGVPFSGTDCIHRIRDASVPASVVQFPCGYFLFESHIDSGIRSSVHNIPEFAFAESVVSLPGYFIVRVDLDRHPALYVEEFHQDRELPSVILVDIFSYDPFEICLHDFFEGVSCQPAVCHDRIDKSHVGHFPALSDLVSGCQFHLVAVLVALHELFSEFFYQSIASPRFFHGHRDELYRIKVFLDFHKSRFYRGQR